MKPRPPLWFKIAVYAGYVAFYAAIALASFFVTCWLLLHGLRFMGARI